MRTTFNTAGQLRPFINVGVQGANGQFQTVNMMVDTGNDVTLIKKSEARRLGLNPDAGSPFSVSGISGVPQTFKMLTRQIKIGSLPPRTVRIGIGDVPDNLLGREDIARDYSITFHGNREIEFTTNVAMASDTCGLDNDRCSDRFRSPNPFSYHQPFSYSTRVQKIRRMVRENYFGGLLEPAELF